MQRRSVVDGAGGRGIAHRAFDPQTGVGIEIPSGVNLQLEKT